MNIANIRAAASEIEKHQAALTWLEEYGVHLNGSPGNAKIIIQLAYASGCTGAAEASAVIGGYLTSHVHCFVHDAIDQCRKIIKDNRAVIQTESNPEA